MKDVNQSISLIKEWSIWLVGIQTSAIGLICAFYDKGNLKIFDSTYLAYSIIFFSLSIIVSSWTLGALPDIIQRVSESDKVHDTDAFTKVPIPLWVFCSAQHWFFIFGLLAFVISAVKQMLP